LCVDSDDFSSLQASSQSALEDLLQSSDSTKAGPDKEKPTLFRARVFLSTLSGVPWKNDYWTSVAAQVDEIDNPTRSLAHSRE